MSSSKQPVPLRPASPEAPEPRPEDQTAAREGKNDRKPDKDTEKQRKKEAKLARDSERPLRSWERYRALVDALDEAFQLVELADRKARFALVIMGALNVVLFLLATRTELVVLIPDGVRRWIALYLVLYAFVAVYFFLQAIESLRPRRFRPHLDYPGPAGPEHYPQGLRYFEDIVLRDLEAHRRAWRDVRVGQLTAELAVQTHILARTNQDKYAALRRLYGGLRVMTVLAAGLVTVLAFSVLLTGESEQSQASLPGAKHSSPGPDVLGTPSRLAPGVVREPSGVAYHPRFDHLFVVGDEGRLLELDGDGRAVGERKVKGDLEDLVVHIPTGNLVLLAEKRSELVWYDPVTREEGKRWRLDDEAVLGRPPAEKNQGFEGLAFREDPAQPGGGVFYLVHQRSPSMIVAIAFDPERPAGTLGSEVVVARWSMKGHHDLAAATYVPSLDRLLVIADAKDRMLVVRMDGTTEAELALPGHQQEGLGLDAAGNLWVADDRGGLLRFPDALPALTAWLAKERANPNR